PAPRPVPSRMAARSAFLWDSARSNRARSSPAVWRQKRARRSRNRRLGAGRARERGLDPEARFAGRHLLRARPPEGALPAHERDGLEQVRLPLRVFSSDDGRAAAKENGVRGEVAKG